MAQLTAVPQHVTALLTHLTSRPGVQSTLILSRKDGSIIQGTGLLAAELAARQVQAQNQNAQPSEASQVASPLEEERESESAAAAAADSTPTPNPADEGSPAGTTPTPTPTPTPSQEQEQSQGEGQQVGGQGQEQKQPYQPTHAETLAAHIFAFVSSASELSLSLSHPPDNSSNNSIQTPKTNGSRVNGAREGLMNGISPDGEAEGHEKEEGDEVKLLRLRTRKHEIVVVPDRKYLLCVVHDAAHSAGGMGGSRGR